MKKALFVSVLFMLISSCEKDNSKSSFEEEGIVAKIAAFDMNCSTCILEFPYGSIKKEIGESPLNRYEAINMNKANFSLGEYVKIKLRKPFNSELRPCITLYPSNNYKPVFITETNDIKKIRINSVNEIRHHEYLYNPDNDSYISLDSILSDSRCPTGVKCIWAGMAEVKFSYSKSADVKYFILNTNSAFRNDTIIDGYKFTLINLKPMPDVDQRTRQEFYSAEIKIEKP